MLYYTIGVTICLLGLGYLYYRKYRGYKKLNDRLDLIISRYVELLQTLKNTQDEYGHLLDKYKYKLSLIVVYQDKLAEAAKVAKECEEKYNLLYEAYNENKDNLKFAEAILAGTPEDI